ncbi:MAG TPA: uracil-DNA glycosylase [Chitinophagales bacterium]|nr:uracil-DNA glycosylase [Chitinophagales bacterium]HQO32229.1 uracil-DNA glycosylase [Chitinophagales bacterium]
MSDANIQMHESWKTALKAEFEKPYFAELKRFLQAEKAAGKTIYPPGSLIFNAFNSTPFDQVRIVILGQDPYHGPGQAHGLCFSVQHGVKPPPSLVNIYKELQSDVGITLPTHGCLQSWTTQGVFLLNAILTVEANKPASHQKRGWEEFTNAAIQQLSLQREGLIFMLWGNFAQQKAALIDERKHTILKAPHPSPFSAHTGFLGCGHFSKANAILTARGEAPVNWQV